LRRRSRLIGALSNQTDFIAPYVLTRLTGAIYETMAASNGLAADFEADDAVLIDPAQQSQLADPGPLPGDVIMPSHFPTFGLTRNARAALHPAAPAAQTSPATPWLRVAQQVLPVRPDAIPSHDEQSSHVVRPFPQFPPQTTPARSSIDHLLEGEADRMAAQVLSSEQGMSMGIDSQAAAPALHRQGAGDNGGRSSARNGSLIEAPATVKNAFGSPGKPLDSSTRAYMESRFGSNLADVRVHTGAEAAAAARTINAYAYTVGQDIFFGAGRYNPKSGEGRRLLAHELSHTVQQSGGSAGKRLSSAARGVYRDPIPQGAAKAAQGTTADTETKKPKTNQVTVNVPTAMLQNLQLTPPSLLTPPQQPSLFSPGNYTLGGSTGGNSLGHPGPSLFQPPSQYSPTSPSILPPAAQYSPYTPSPLAPVSQPTPALTPTPGSAASATPAIAPKAPDRVSLHDFGTLSIGARFGFPDLSKDTKPGDPPSALQESIQKAEVLNFIFTGAPPSVYSVDPGKLVGAVWGIVTQIDPSATSKIAASLASKPAGGGPSYQLDATILFKMGSGSGPTASQTGGGAGATLTIIF
jgi:hypothetical protein